MAHRAHRQIPYSTIGEKWFCEAICECPCQEAGGSLVGQARLRKHSHGGLLLPKRSFILASSEQLCPVDGYSAE